MGFFREVGRQIEQFKNDAKATAEQETDDERDDTTENENVGDEHPSNADRDADEDDS